MGVALQNIAVPAVRLRRINGRTQSVLVQVIKQKEATGHRDPC